MSSQEFRISDQIVETKFEKNSDGWAAVVNNQAITLRSIGRNLFSANLNGKQFTIAAIKNKETYYLDIDSVLIELTEPSAENFASTAGAHGSKDKVFAPMPGKIVKVLVNVGDAVTEKQPLVIVEAMKMENNVVSAAKGKVKAVYFAAGDQVGTDQPIIEIDVE